MKLPPRAPPPVLPIFDPTVSSGPSDSAAPARAAAAATPPPSLLAPEPTPNALRLAAPFGSALERRAPTLGPVIDLHAFGDSYTSYDPAPPSALAGAARLLDRLAPIRTHERAIQDIDGLFFGVVFGFTISQLDLVRKSQHGIEAIQVIKPDGSSNLETVLGRLQLGHNQRIELQGPALNTSLAPGSLPLGARFVGIGLTSDVASAMNHDALSYTLEVKLTERSVAELAALAAPGAAEAAAHALADVGGDAAAAVVASAVLGAVPVLSTALAAASARRAVHVLRSEGASKEMKTFAVAHALADTVRIFGPLTGTLMNAGLVGVAALCGWVHVHHARHALPVGPRDASSGNGGGGAPPADTPT